MAFILGLPANEIVLPILIMCYISSGQMIELDSIQALRDLLVANGWTWLTAVCTMLFCLNHFPCGTTLLTIKKETQSIKWPLVTFAVTTATGVILCFIVAQSVRLFGTGLKQPIHQRCKPNARRDSSPGRGPAFFFALVFRLCINIRVSIR
jgi:ferrous iron transport protein B